MPLRELLVVWALLILLTIVAYGPYARDGGFSLDDWPNGAGALYSGGLGGAIDYFGALTSYRPVLVVYVPLTYQIFGTHMGLHLAWAAGIATAVSGLLYAILRSLRLARLHAGLIAALVLLFPWFDSTRMWATASQVTLGVAIALAGIWVALIALRRRSWRLHGVALLLYATSILTYEIALPLIAASGLLYVVLVGWRTARLRWAADMLVVLAGLAWVATQTTRKSSGLADNLEHLKWIVLQGGTLMGRAGLPLGPQHTTLVLVVLAGLAAIALATSRGDRKSATRSTPSMVPWLLVGSSGLAVAALGWAMFIPADPYYTPSVYGFTNRVNGLAGIGLVMTVYAGCGILGSLVGRIADRPRVAATWATALLAVGLGITYKGVLERHADIWVSAFRAQMGGLGQMMTQFPTLPDGTTVYTSGYPAYQTLGVPIFSTTWDVNGAIKLQYRNPTLSAFPVLPGARFVCSQTSITMMLGKDAIGGSVPLGRARFVDVGSGRTSAPRDRRECQRAARTFVPGPLYLTTEY